MDVFESSTCRDISIPRKQRGYLAPLLRVTNGDNLGRLQIVGEGQGFATQIMKQSQSAMRKTNQVIMEGCSAWCTPPVHSVSWLWRYIVI
jgi:hypothetical protein